MQQALLPFLNGQPAVVPQHVSTKKQAKVAEVYLGQPCRDDAFDCAALLCNFFDAFYHQIVCLYGRYSKEQIKSSSFNGIRTQQCINKKVVEYFQLTRSTLRKWLILQQIKTLAVVLLLNETKEIVAEFRVNLYEPKVGMKRVV